MNPQLHPLELNPETGEPFLRLSRHENIILTPARLSDGPAMVEILNDERVYQWLSSPPHPYLPEHAEWWLNHAKAKSDALLAQLEAAAREDGGAPPMMVDDCPVGFIREVLADGSDVFIGNIDFGLAQKPWELEGTGKEKQEKALRDPNDPDIWMCGDYLASSHHRRGIMSDAFHTLLHRWGIPRMGVRRMVVTTLVGNQGSVRVFEKNGFKFRKTVDDAMVVRGTTWGVNVLDWSYEEEETS